ncbi:MAG TPA: SDR family oxidoreductase [Noviherbaspirillum sp.]|jgi:dTDP-4-dehydrorhamnose reductase|uniref:dTDP-4-dehydrorhamnose reductase family protein n=1 Tax=Noviherbaspirillum sp. TaxID=1926288 RepID=UPI002F958680
MPEQETVSVLVLGASGMLGNAVMRVLAESTGFEVTGSVRSAESLRLLPESLRTSVRTGVDVEHIDNLTRLFASVRPDVVVNAIGLVKQLAEADDPLAAIPVNALLPHRLARLCEIAGARLIHMSTDCVFSGSKGMYKESDVPDAADLYGRSKHMGEVDYPHAVTLRTSIIGHELAGARSLIGWFLAQQGSTRGFRRAVFSGLPTVEIARIIRDHVIPNPALRGVYHVSAEPINKFDLLSLVAETYGKEIRIVPDDGLVIDRSLDSSRFRQATGFQPAPWPALVKTMHAFG